MTTAQRPSELDADGQRKGWYPSQAEHDFVKFARARKWRYTKRGWPDFLCVSQTGEWFAVEVKGKTKNGAFSALSPHQVDALDFLTALGVRCFISDGHDIVPYAEKHRRKRPRIRPRKVSRAYHPQGPQVPKNKPGTNAY